MEITDEQKKEQEEFDKQKRLLIQLEKREDFKIWRDMFVKPILDQLEVNFNKNMDTMDEASLRGNLKYMYMIKYLFYQIFEN